MALEYTLKEISVQFANAQPHLVDAITKRAPFIEKVKWEKSTHGLFNLAEAVTNVQGAGFVPIDAPLPNMSVESELKKIDLSIMGGRLEVPRDKANMYGGKDKYLADHQPRLYRTSGMKAEKAIIYNKLKTAAVHYERLIRAQADSSTGTFSIIAVRMTSGENNGLFDPSLFSQGTLLQTTPLCGGSVYVNKDGISVYGWESVGYFGWQVLSPDSCAAIVNIDATHLPTAMMLDDILEQVDEGEDGDVMLLAHPKMKKYINALKGDKLVVRPDEMSVSQSIKDWDGVPIIYTKNMLPGTETAIPA